jgi:hypothetical protein
VVDTDREQITRAVLDYFEGWFDIDVEDVHEDIASVTVRSAVYREYLHLVRTAEGWRIANALWRHS